MIIFVGEGNQANKKMYIRGKTKVGKITINNAMELAEKDLKIDDEQAGLLMAVTGQDDIGFAKELAKDMYFESVQEFYESEPEGEYPMTVEQYLVARLDAEGRVRNFDFYTDEDAPEDDGWYWFDQYDKWIQVNTNK